MTPNVLVQSLFAIQFFVADGTFEDLHSVRVHSLRLQRVVYHLTVVGHFMREQSALRLENGRTKFAQHHRLPLPVLMLHLVESLQVALLLIASFKHLRAELAWNVPPTVIVHVGH